MRMRVADVSEAGLDEPGLAPGLRLGGASLLRRVEQLSENTVQFESQVAV